MNFSHQQQQFILLVSLAWVGLATNSWTESLEYNKQCQSFTYSMRYQDTVFSFGDLSKVMSISVQDNMEDSSSISWQFGEEGGGSKTLKVTNAPCSQDLLLDFCFVDSNGNFNFTITQQNGVCYLDETDPEQQPYVQSAIYCANVESLRCKNNEVSQCQFVDCMETYVGAEKTQSEYLLSICLPLSFNSEKIIQTCYDIRNGNDYVSYSKSSSTVTGKFGLIDMSIWSTVVIVVASLMCCICSLSCFYNYRVFRTREPPFWVPGFCPDCLFPRNNLMGTLGEGQQDLDYDMDLSQEEDSDPKLAIGGGRVSYKEPNPLQVNNAYGKANEGTAEMKQTNRYRVPQFEDFDDY